MMVMIPRVAAPPNCGYSRVDSLMNYVIQRVGTGTQTMCERISMAIPLVDILHGRRITPISRQDI